MNTLLLLIKPMRKLAIILAMLPLTSIVLHAQDLPKIKSPLLAKGRMYAGFTFGFKKNEAENQDLFLVFIDNQKRSSFDFSLDAGYFIKPGWALGAKTNYAHSKKVGIQTNSQGLKANVESASSNFGFYAAMKNYLELDTKHRFYLYNLLLAGGSADRTLTESTIDGVLTKTYTKENLAELKVAPGLMVHVMKGFAVEAGAEIAGIRAKWADTQVNNEPTTKTSSIAADFSINLLRFSLGFYYFFPIRRP